MYGIKAPVAQGSGQPTYNRSIQVRFLAGAPFITYTHNLRTAQKGLEKTDEDEQEEGREMSESITEELREYAAEHSYWRRGTEYVTLNDLLPIADRIDARFTHELEAKQDEVDALKSDNSALQVRLDASIPVPVDAEGVPWTWADVDKPFSLTDGDKTTEGTVRETAYAWPREGWWIVDQYDTHYPADRCRHGTLEPPETIDAIRDDARRFDEIAAPEWDGVIPNTLGCVNRAYDCGKRDGAGGLS